VLILSPWSPAGEDVGSVAGKQRWLAVDAARQHSALPDDNANLGCAIPRTGGESLTICRAFLGIENGRNAGNLLNLKDIVVLVHDLLTPCRMARLPAHCCLPRAPALACFPGIRSAE